MPDPGSVTGAHDHGRDAVNAPGTASTETPIDSAEASPPREGPTPDAPPPTAGSRINQIDGFVKSTLDFESNSVLVATILLAVVIGVIHPGFFAWSQIKNMLQNSVYIGILAAGMAFLISMREIDLSVGSIFGLVVIGTALLIRGGMNPWLAGGLGICMGAAMGLFNAVLVQGIAIPAIIATLATLNMFQGLGIALSSGQQVQGQPTTNSFFVRLGGQTLGLPTSVWVLIIVTIALTLVLRFTPFGYRVRSIGSNPEAAAFSGISIPRTRIQALMLMGALAGLAGILGLAFFESGDPNIGTGFELQAIAAAIIGGTPLRGGSATVVGAVIGAILLSVVSSGLVFFNVPLNWSQFATGAVILLAVALDSLVRRRRKGEGAGLAL